MKKTTAIKLFFIFFMAQNASAHVYSRKDFQAQLSVGLDNACAIDEDGMHCFAPGSGANARWPVVAHVNSVSLGVSKMCTIGTGGLTCGAQYGPRNYQLPHLSSVRQVSVGLQGACAIDDSGAHCWGNSENGDYVQSHMPPLKNPRQISAGEVNFFSIEPDFCALDDDGAHCFGIHSGGQPPPLKNPVQISAGQGKSCAIDDDGLHCWGSDLDWVNFDFKLHHPRLVSVRDAICALDDEGVYCWNEFGSRLKVPPLNNPTNIAVGWGRACALDDGGMVCWDIRQPGPSTMNGQPVPTPPFQVRRFADVRADHPTVENPFFNLDQIDLFLTIASRTSTPAHAKYLAQLKSFAKSRLMAGADCETLSRARYMLAKLISPTILSLDSPYAMNSLAPKYKESLLSAETELQIMSLSQIQQTALTREVAMRSVLAALNVVKDFISANDSSALSSLTRTIGQVIATPSDPNIKILVSELDLAIKSLSFIESSSRSRFLVDVLRTAREWLARGY